MKNVALLVCITSFSVCLSAQSEQLIIKTSSKGYYVEHKVTAKENFYSIGRSFNVHPKHLALFNSLDMSRGLSIGQTIKIPLSDTNYSHKSDFGTPVYYITGSNETVYNISTNNGVLMERLRKWNQIADDKFPAGSKLIVGFLFNSTQQGIAVANPKKEIVVDKRKPDSTKSAVAKSENVVNEPRKEEIKKEEEPKKEDVTKIKPGPAKKKVAKEDLQKNEQGIQGKEDVTQIEQAPAKKEVIKEDLRKNEQLTEAKDGQKSTQGYFRTLFEQQVKQQPISKEQTVTSGIFKTASGWSDTKYYLLMDGIEPGTIVRITNPTNNKIIYAKLLGEMNGLKQNQGLNIRISNAAASALDVSETDKFIVKLNY